MTRRVLEVGHRGSGGRNPWLEHLFGGRAPLGTAHRAGIQAEPCVWPGATDSRFHLQCRKPISHRATTLDVSLDNFS